MKQPADPVASRAPVSVDLMAARFAALAHPVRIGILTQLACAEACCCKEVVAATDLAQSTVSQHLKVLVEAGLVRYEALSKQSRYSIDRQALASIRSDFDALVQLCCDAR